MTRGQQALTKAKSDLEWAIGLLDKSATPEALDVNRLVADIADALRLRLDERDAMIGRGER